MILIAGPCVIENYDILRRTAKYILKATQDKKINVYFKASCIKDNRTNIHNFSGVGFQEGLQMLQRIRDEFGLKITTDFHNADHIYNYGTEVDLVQIPAYLAQQTSLLHMAAIKSKEIHIKKPQFLGPLEANNLVLKLRDFGYEGRILLTDRGTMFGYNQTMIDPRHIPLLKADKVLVDITHPNKNYPGLTQSNIRTLGMSAIASGADGIFLETATNCETALCDAGTMLHQENFAKLIDELYNLNKYINYEE